MHRFWKAAVWSAGIGAVGAFVFLTLYREWLHIGLFSQLSSNQTFILMLLFLGLTFSALLSMVIAYIWTRPPRRVKRSSRAAAEEPQRDRETRRRKHFILGYTLQVYMGMHLDDTVRASNLAVVSALRIQLIELLRLLGLGSDLIDFPDTLEYKTILSRIEGVDRAILAKLEVLDITDRAYYANGKWLGRCLAAVAAAKAPNVDAEDVRTLLGLVLDRYEDTRSQDERFPIPKNVRDQFSEICADVAHIRERGVATDEDYQRVSAKVLQLTDCFD